jgi:hypothetical protein
MRHCCRGQLLDLHPGLIEQCPRKAHVVSVHLSQLWQCSSTGLCVCESTNTSPGFGCFQLCHLSHLRSSQAAMARQSCKGSCMYTNAKICNAKSTNGHVSNVPVQCKVNKWPVSNVPMQSQPMASVKCKSNAHDPITVSLNIEATTSSLHATS